MTSQQKQRLKWIIIMVIIVAGGAIFVFSALQQSMMYFMTPAEILEKQPTTGIRLGGMVAMGSIIKDPSTMTVKFDVTDFKQTIGVTFTGLTPDLFKEGQGVVADGHWNGHIFEADRLLAKHDENYMPPEIEGKIK